MEAIPRASLVLRGLVGLTRRSSPRPHETSLCRSTSQVIKRGCLVSTSCSCRLCLCHLPSSQTESSVVGCREQETWLRGRVTGKRHIDEQIPAHVGMQCLANGRCSCPTGSLRRVACPSCWSPACHLDWHGEHHALAGLLSPSDSASHHHALAAAAASAAAWPWVVGLAVASLPMDCACP